MSWIKDCKEFVIDLGRTAGVLSTQEERDTDIQVHIEENNKKIVELRKEQKITWGKAAVELREMGVTQEDFDLLNSIDPLGTTVLPAAKKPKKKPVKDASTDTETTNVEVDVANDDDE